jgi:outer membrane protein insertion porin family
MLKKNTNFLLTLFLFFTVITPSFGEIVKKIEINGNERISKETIILFSKVNINDDLKSNDINEILKRLYETNFFQNVVVNLKTKTLTIFVEENPIIENISYNGIKSETLKAKITKNLKLLPRSSYNEILLNDDKNQIKLSLRDSGYYFSKVNVQLVELKDKKVDIIFDIDLGQKAKIKKISFIGDKKFKDGKLRSLIVSEEFKFWKIISGKKYLNENITNLDERLLKKYYLNKGYYDVEINSSFAKLLNNDDEFELIFNINAKNKFFFGDLSIELPSDFEKNNFVELNELFDEIRGQPYSINLVEKILNKIDTITINEQYQSIKSTVTENILSDKINLLFKIEETQKYFVERINILGNNITRENVIRNQLVIDEGDPYNEILKNKSINEIKSLNFFKNVNSEVIDGKEENSKIINISVEEKATGEISAGAGFGTSGELFEFAVRENNYLGKGLSVDTRLSLSTERINGKFIINNPNYKNSEKSVNFAIQALQDDKLSNFGYKSSKYGSSIGTKFEYLEDFRIGFDTSAYIERIETDGTASARQKTQEGSYFDNYLNLSFDYDKRNQKYKTTDGFISSYSINLPIISENNTLTNTYNYKVFSELFEENISSFSMSFSSASSITGEILSCQKDYMFHKGN